MKIKNIRLGFATNSSSSHSIIFDPTITTDSDTDNFGWNFFTAASREAKATYLASTIRHNLSLTDSFIDIILRGLGYDDDIIQNSHVDLDHQSLIALPFDYTQKNVSIEFIQELNAYLSRTGIVILGGNDNTEQEHHYFNETKTVSTLDSLRDRNNSSLVCRADGDWWTIFDKSNGSRITLSFKDNPTEYAPVTPLLLDFKITDFCTAGCTFCYQGSTAAGKHLSSDHWFYSKLLSDAKVFEVTIGGGEPTEYPLFVELIESLANAGIVVNFTTRSLSWLENEQLANRIMSNIGAFAYSASSDNGLKRLARIVTIMQYRNYSMRQFNVQLIPAIMSQYELKNILAYCAEHYIRVTLLGYKDAGRGLSYKSIRNATFDENKWVDIVEELVNARECPTLAIDTTLAKTHERALIARDIPDYLYHIHEGKYSMYIDGVTHQYGPSSYHTDLLQPIPKVSYEDTNALRSMFKTIQAV